jgi:acetyl-CoA carboxylase biotin carboxylase subunit
VKTTIPFHLKLMQHPQFVSGDFHIQFLEKNNLNEGRSKDDQS